MIRNLLVFVLFATSSCVVLYGQTPEAKQDPEKGSKVFAFSFDGDGSYLGVQTQEVTKENFAKFGLSDVRGVAVEKVLENSPAAAAGLQTGDVIVRFEGEEVTGTRKLTRLISEIAPDHQAKVAVLRGGSEREISVTLAKRPAPAFENGNFEWSTPMALPELPKMGKMPDMPELPKLQGLPGFKVAPNGDGNTFFFSSNSRQIGVSLTSLTKQLGDYFGVADGNGLLISSVRENSPAAKAGLKAGDVIVGVDGKAVKGDFDILRTLNEKKEGDVELTIVRDRSRQTIHVTPETVQGDNGALFQKFDDQGPFAPMIVGPGAPKALFGTPGQVMLTAPGRVL
ncbi:MAG: PDZ domain-containing protein [Acidobacteriota bacterium]